MRPQEMVLEFHRTYGLGIGESPSILNRTQDLIDLRLRLIDEEVQELKDGLAAGDLIEVADALGDLLYVTYGAAIVFGIDLDAVVKEIHRSNMTKLGEDGKPIVREDGKILKGPHFEDPKLVRVLIDQKKLPQFPRREHLHTWELFGDSPKRCADCGEVMEIH